MGKRQNSEQATNRDLQRADFIDSLYKTMRAQTREVVAQRDQFIVLVSSYLEDDLSEEECLELLLLDGLTREAAMGYLDIAKVSTKKAAMQNAEEYSFQFEDPQGRVWNSFDLNLTVLASEGNAWEKAEEVLSEGYPMRSYRVVSIDKVS